MNVLFIGLGGIGQRHLRVFKKLYPLSRVYAIRSSNNNNEITDSLNLDKSVDIEEKYRITRCNDINEATRFNIDFAIVSNPTSLHLDTSIDLINNKIPVLVEKPISDKKNIEKLIQCSKTKKIPFKVGYMMRFHPCFNKLRDLLESDIIGKIYNINVNVNSYFPSWHKYEKYNELYAGRRELGGGVVLTEIHEIDLLFSLFGLPEYLFAVGGTRSNLEIDVEDNVSALFKFNKENYEFSSALNMSFVQKTPYRKMHILGEHGDILWDITENKISMNNYTEGNKYSESFKDFQRNDLFEAQLISFINFIKNKNENQMNQSFEESIGSHKIAMAIKESLTSNSIVHF